MEGTKLFGNKYNLNHMKSLAGHWDANKTATGSLDISCCVLHRLLNYAGLRPLSWYLNKTTKASLCFLVSIVVHKCPTWFCTVFPFLSSNWEGQTSLAFPDHQTTTGSAHSPFRLPLSLTSLVTCTSIPKTTSHWLCSLALAGATPHPRPPLGMSLWSVNWWGDQDLNNRGKKTQ